MPIPSNITDVYDQLIKGNYEAIKYLDMLLQDFIVDGHRVNENNTTLFQNTITFQDRKKLFQSPLSTEERHRLFENLIIYIFPEDRVRHLTSACWDYIVELLEDDRVQKVIYPQLADRMPTIIKHWASNSDIDHLKQNLLSSERLNRSLERHANKLQKQLDDINRKYVTLLHLHKQLLEQQQKQLPLGAPAHQSFAVSKSQPTSLTHQPIIIGPDPRLTRSASSVRNAEDYKAAMTKLDDAFEIVPRPGEQLADKHQRSSNSTAPTKVNSRKKTLTSTGFF